MGARTQARHVDGRHVHRFVEAVAAGLIVAGLLGAHQIHRTVGDDAIEPRAEIRARLEAAELSIRAKEAFLDHIFGILLIASHPERQPEHTPAVPLDEGAKRIVVALAGTGQDGCSFGRVHLPRLDGASDRGLALFRAHERGQRPEGKGHTIGHIREVE